jgi:hypothetical protein
MTIGKIQHPSMIKNSQHNRYGRNVLNTIKPIYDKSPDSIIFDGGKLKVFSYKIRNKTNSYHFHSNHFDRNLSI